DLVATDLHGRTALSELFRFDVQAFSPDAEAPAIADLLGAAAVLTLNDRKDRKCVVNGIVTSIARAVGAKGGGGFSLTVEPAVAALGVGRSSRAFQKMDVTDIVKKVLDVAGVDASTVDWRTKGSYPKRDYCAQYRESYWDFIERLCCEEGIYYFFELGDDAT